MKIRVIGVGDNVVDHYLHTNMMYPGGNALNFAVYARMRGYDAAYLGVFGDDQAATHVYRTLNRLGIKTNHCRFVHGEGGRAKVTLKNGDRIFLGSNRGGVAKDHPLTFSKLDLAYLKEYELLHTSVFSYIDDQLPALSRAGIRVSYDFSNRFDMQMLRERCPYIWCACLSSSERSEEENVALMETVKSFGCQMVLLTSGEKGAMLLTNRNLYRQSPWLVQAKDTMGAGDSFLTAFLTSYLEAVGDGRDYPDTAGTEGILSYKEFEDDLIRVSLHRAAVFSAETCLKAGSFGFGTEWETSEERDDMEERT